jgi:WD40 repeat protein
VRKILLLLCVLIAATATAQQPRLMLPMGHTDVISHVIFSPDGKLIVTASKDKTVKIWDTNTGKLLANLKGHTKEVTSVEINKPGTHLLTTATLDTNAFLWSLKTGKLVAILHNRSYEQAIFSPDGKSVFKSTSGEQPVIYNTLTGEPKVSLVTWERYIRAAAFSPDGKQLTSGEKQVFDTETGALLFKLSGFGSLQKILYTPDGSKIVGSLLDKTIGIWSNKGDLLFQLKGHTEYIKNITMSPDGKRLISTGMGSDNVMLWDVDNGQLVTQLKGSSGWTVSDISFSPDLKDVIITDYNGARQFDLATGTPANNGVSFSSYAAFVPGQPYLVRNKKARDESIVEIIETSSGKVIANLQKATSIEMSAFSPTEPKVASKTEANSITVWDTRTGTILTNLKGPTARLTSGFIDPSNNHLITNSYGSKTSYRTQIWTVNNALLRPSSPFESTQVLGSYFHPGGKTMVTMEQVGDRKVYKLRNVIDGSVIKENLSPRCGDYDTKALAFTPDGSYIHIKGETCPDRIFDALTGQELKTISHEHAWATAINDGATRLAIYSPRGIEIIDTETGNIINKFPIHAAGYDPILFTGYKNRLLVFDVPSAFLYEENRSKPILTFSNGYYHFNKSRTKLLVRNMDTLTIWNLVTAKRELTYLLPELESRSIGYWDAIWSPDESSIIYSTNVSQIVKINAKSGTVEAQMSGRAHKLSFNKDQKLMFGIYDELISVFDLSSFQPVSHLKGHDNKVLFVSQITDHSKLLSVAEDHTARIWDLTSGKLLYTYLLLDYNYQFTLLPGGYYQANPAASKLLYYVSEDLKPISFEQLDVKYNRPDLVLEATGSTDAALISAYKKAYDKRMKRLGIDTTAFREGYSVPVADFAERGQLSYHQSTNKLKLQIKAIDSAYHLDRFNVWVNESPLFGSRGISLRSKKRNSFDTTINVPLSHNINSLETSVTNINGTESFRMPMELTYNPSTPEKEKLYFVGIGVDEFKETNYNLQYSAKDVRDLANALKLKYGDDIVIDTLFNRNVSVDKIVAIKNKLLKTTVNDKVIVAYSGHGVLGKQLDYFLSTYSMNFKQPENGGLPYDALESLLDGIPARKKLMLIDACHSGEVDKEEMQRMNKAQASLQSQGTTITKKGIGDEEFTSNSKLGMKNSFDLMQELFVNVGRSTGATVISAAAGTQFAQERGELQNGVFTFAILELMKEKAGVTVTELKDHVNRRVVELTDGLQVPTTRSETKLVDWKVW